LPMPNAAADCSGVSYLRAIRQRSYGTRFARRQPRRPSMADKFSERDDQPVNRQDEIVNRSGDDQVRGIADDETDAGFDDSEDLDEEDEAEEEEGSTF
jgi:hypothetical protein